MNLDRLFERFGTDFTFVFVRTEESNKDPLQPWRGGEPSELRVPVRGALDTTVLRNPDGSETSKQLVYLRSPLKILTEVRQPDTKCRLEIGDTVWRIVKVEFLPSEAEVQFYVLWVEK